jgi:uncharacterized protein YeaO (DUF488 family)
MTVKLKRAYESPAAEDGERYLVERLWPRGVKKADLALTAWLKDLAPSTELRKWYGHKVERWPEFTRRYKSELESPSQQAALGDLARKARVEDVTLVVATRLADISGGAVLKEMIGQRLSD